MTSKTADQLPTVARALLPRRPSPAQALAAQAKGAPCLSTSAAATSGGPAG
jgi:hypothetical protein